MLGRIWDKISGTDAVVRALRRRDRTRLPDAFARSTIFFLQLPPGCEAGIDPNISQEEFLAHIRAGAEDLSERERFTPLCRIREGRRAVLLFTQQTFVEKFAHAYVRRFKRLMQFEVLGVEGRIASQLLGVAEAVVINASTKYEYELTLEDVSLLKQYLLSAGTQEK